MLHESHCRDSEGSVPEGLAPAACTMCSCQMIALCAARPDLKFVPVCVLHASSQVNIPVK